MNSEKIETADQHAEQRARWEDLKSRAGTFRIRNEIIETAHEALFALFSRMIVVRCEALYAQDALEYTALSPDFAMTDPLFSVPEYAIQVQATDGKVSKIEFVRVP